MPSDYTKKESSRTKTIGLAMKSTEYLENRQWSKYNLNLNEVVARVKQTFPIISSHQIFLTGISRCQSRKPQHHHLFGLILILLLAPTIVLAGCREAHRDSCEAICPANSIHNCTIRAAVILPASPIYEMSLPKILPALELVEERIRTMRILPENVKFEWMAYDDRCDASYAAINAMDAYGKDCAHVIFGPACDYALATVGRITKYFRSEGTPLITVGGFTFDFQKPKTTCMDEFYMLLRVGMMSFRDIGMFSVAVMKKYNWNHALYFYERNGYYNVGGLHTCHLAMNTLAEFYRDANITYSSFVTDSGTGNLTEDMIREIGVAHGDILPTGTCLVVNNRHQNNNNV